MFYLNAIRAITAGRMSVTEHTAGIVTVDIPCDGRFLEMLEDEGECEEVQICRRSKGRYPLNHAHCSPSSESLFYLNKLMRKKSL